MKRKIFTASIILLAIVLFHNKVYAQWVQTNGPYEQNVGPLVMCDTVLYAETVSGPTFRTTDNGINWTPITINGTIHPTGPIAYAGNKLFVVFADSGLCLSTDNGINWTVQKNRLGLYLDALTFKGNDLYSLSRDSMYRTTNDGSDWETVGHTSSNLNYPSLVTIDSFFFLNNYDGLLFRSVDNAANWVIVDSELNIAQNNSIINANNYIFAGCYGSGIVRSSDSGTSWNRADNGLSIIDVFTMIASGKYVFAGTHNGGVFLSTDNGDHWTSFNSGLPIVDVASFAVGNGYLFAATYGGGVWRRPLSDFTTAVDDRQAPIPAQVTLRQNEPNPFSATTMIEYSLPQTENASLKVFNALGEEVATVIHGEISAGFHSVQFHSGDLQPGMYFYRLTAGSSSQTGKMILTR
jgi:hypothetical protein